jgi:hypothetical protein
MFGQGWVPPPPLGGEPWGAGELGVVVDGVVVDGVVVDGVVVDGVVVVGGEGVVLVDWVLVEELGAAAAPAIPATAPPVARAPTTSPVRIMFALLIREPPMDCWWPMLTMLQPLPKQTQMGS